MTDIPADTGPIIHSNAFLALLLPEAVKNEITNALSKHMSDPALCRPPENWYITLNAIGDITKRGEKNFLGLLQTIKFSPTPKISLSKFSAFSSADSQGYALSGQASDALRQWQSAIKSAILALDYEVKPNYFIPHVLLADDIPASSAPEVAFELTFEAQAIALMAQDDQGYKVIGTQPF